MSSIHQFGHDTMVTYTFTNNCFTHRADSHASVLKHGEWGKYRAVSKYSPLFSLDTARAYVIIWLIKFICPALPF